MTQVDIIKSGIAKRYARETRFRIYGLSSIICGVAFLVFLLFTSISNGYTALLQTHIGLDIGLFAEDFGDDLSRESLSKADYSGIIKKALRQTFPEVTKRKEKKALYRIISGGAQYQLRENVMDDPSLIGRSVTYWLLADDEVDVFVKGRIDRDVPEQNRRIKNNTIGWIDELSANKRVEKRFNIPFFTAGDSREPEQAGIRGAVMGSVFTILVTMLLAFPIVSLQRFICRSSHRRTG